MLRGLTDVREEQGDCKHPQRVEALRLRGMASSVVSHPFSRILRFPSTRTTVNASLADAYRVWWSRDNGNRPKPNEIGSFGDG